MIVAWHEVPGTAPPQKSRPVGYGMIRAGAYRFEDWREEISNAVSVSRIEMIPKCIGGVLDHVRHLFSLPPVGSAAPDHTVPYGTVSSRDAFPGTSCLAMISLSLRDKSHSPIELLTYRNYVQHLTNRSSLTQPEQTIPASWSAETRMLAQAGMVCQFQPPNGCSQVMDVGAVNSLLRPLLHGFGSGFPGNTVARKYQYRSGGYWRRGTDLRKQT